MVAQRRRQAEACNDNNVGRDTNQATGRTHGEEEEEEAQTQSATRALPLLTVIVEGRRTRTRSRC